MTPASGSKISDEPSSASSTSGLVDLARSCYRAGKPVADDPVLRDEIVKILIRQRALAETSRRAQVPSLAEHPMRLPLQRKLVLSELLQDTARLACAIEGIASSLALGDDKAPAGGQWPLAHMNSYGFTIAAGSNEVQRNILGERVLGLAKSK